MGYRLAAQRPARQYEFPTGYNAYFGPERFQVGEQFFYHSPQLVVRKYYQIPIYFQSDICAFQASNPNLPKSIPALITEALRACDPELRQVLMGNVVLTGGGSQFSGFADRLSTELTRSFPHVGLLGCYFRRYLPLTAPFFCFGFLLDTDQDSCTW